jgi:hypothetical protein
MYEINIHQSTTKYNNRTQIKQTGYPTHKLKNIQIKTKGPPTRFTTKQKRERERERERDTFT